MNKLRILLGAAAVFALAIPATAQTMEKPWFLRLGLGLPTDLDVITDTGFYVGGGKRLEMNGILSRDRGMPAIELDWLHLDGNGVKFDSVGAWFTERVPLDQNMMMRGEGYLYGGLGLGIVFNRVDAGFTNEETEFGAQALLGYQVNEDFFVEAQYRYAGTAVNNFDADSFNFVLGYRF